MPASAEHLCFSITCPLGPWTTEGLSLLRLDGLWSWALAHALLQKVILMQNSSWLWKKSYLEPSDDQWNPGSAGGKCWRPKELRNSLVIAGKKSEVGHKPNPQCIPTLRKPSKEGRSPSLPYKHGCGSWQGCKYNIFYSPISVLSFTVLVFYLVSNSQEFVAEPITVRKMHKDHVNTDLTSRAHLTASGCQWSCGDLLSCH